MESILDMNENLNERFGRGTAIRNVPRTATASFPLTLNLTIRKYAETADQPADQPHWTGFREIPSSKEVFDEGRTEHGTALELTENTIVGPYVSKEEYLEVHYRLLREDAVAPLRDVVSEIQFYPQLMEKDSDNGAYIYERVRQHGCLSCNICSLWLGLHHGPDIRQCRYRSPRYLLYETDRKKSQLGAIKTFTNGCSPRTDSRKGHVCIYLPRSNCCS